MDLHCTYNLDLLKVSMHESLEMFVGHLARVGERESRVERERERERERVERRERERKEESETKRGEKNNVILKTILMSSCECIFSHFSISLSHLYFSPEVTCVVLT